MRSVCPRLSFVGMCLWAMLTTREIQGSPYWQPFWNSYNSQIRPMRPASNTMQSPWFYPRRYPYRFLGMPINNVRPYASDRRLQKGKGPTGDGRWINAGNGIANGFAGGINFRPVPMIVFPILPQRVTTQRGTPPRNDGAAPVEKSEESSADRGVSSSSEYPAVLEEATRTPQGEENPREESPTSTSVKPDRESVSPACQGNCEDAREDSISILIEEALRNGELLRSDEWLRWQNATKYGARESVQREEEEEDVRENSTLGSAERDRGPTSSCRGNCTDDSGSEVSRDLADEASPVNDGSSRHDDERIGKQDGAKRREEVARKPSEREDVVQESRVPVCGNSTFCAHAARYPEELVNRAIRRNDSLRLFQSVDPVSEVGDRLEYDELNDSPFCGSYVRLIYPRSAETMNRRWLYVVNQDNLRQGVRIETCAKEDSVCGDLDDYLPGGYKAFCKQKYIYRELIAVDNGIVKKDTFRFPSSCCCHREFIR